MWNYKLYQPPPPPQPHGLRFLWFWEICFVLYCLSRFLMICLPALPTFNLLPSDATALHVFESNRSCSEAKDLRQAHFWSRSHFFKGMYIYCGKVRARPIILFNSKFYIQKPVLKWLHGYFEMSGYKRFEISPLCILRILIILYFK